MRLIPILLSTSSKSLLRGRHSIATRGIHKIKKRAARRKERREKENREKRDRLLLIIIHGPLRRVTHPSWKMKRRKMPYARHGKEPVNHRRPSPPAVRCGASRRGGAFGTKLRHEAGRPGVDSESSGTHQTMRAITMHSSRASAPGHPPTPLDNARQMYRLICQYCPTFVSLSCVCPADAYAWVGSGHGSMMTFVS